VSTFSGITSLISSVVSAVTTTENTQVTKFGIEQKTNQQADNYYQQDALINDQAGAVNEITKALIILAVVLGIVIVVVILFIRRKP